MKNALTLHREDTMNIIEYLHKYRENGTHAPAIRCKDGFHMSVQASHLHYCSPRLDGKQNYTAVEVGYPSERVEELIQYAESPERPTDTVYGWVPVHIIEVIIEKHGGMMLPCELRDEVKHIDEQEKTFGSE